MQSPIILVDISKHLENEYSKHSKLVPIVGIILGCLFSSLALVMMKEAHNRVQQSNGQESPYCTKFWIWGFIILLFGSFLYVIALSFGNQVLLGSSSSLSIIFNTIFSVIFLKEKIKCNDIGAIIMICIGTVLFLSIAKNDHRAYTENQLFNLFQKPLAYLYLGISIFLSICVFIYVHRFKNHLRDFYTFHICHDF